MTTLPEMYVCMYVFISRIKPIELYTQTSNRTERTGKEHDDYQQKQNISTKLNT